MSDEPSGMDHKARHMLLHNALDELCADYLRHHPYPSDKRLSNTTVMELLEWSFSQTQAPTEPPNE